MSKLQSLKVFTAVITWVPMSAYAADQVIQSDGGFLQMTLAIATTLAAAAIVAAIKSWSDVNVLKREVQRLEREVEGAAEHKYVKEFMERIEKRLDNLDERLRQGIAYSKG